MKSGSGARCALALAGAMAMGASMAGADEHGRAVDTHRECVRNQLIAIGTEPDDASAMVAELTPDDLVLFASHPNMIQRGGAKATDTAWILGTIVVVGVIALAVASG